jgi:hypothetical protein
MATAREPTNRPDTYQRLPLATPISHLRTAAGTYIGLCELGGKRWIRVINSYVPKYNQKLATITEPVLADF